MRTLLGIAFLLHGALPVWAAFTAGLARVAIDGPPGAFARILILESDATRIVFASLDGCAVKAELRESIGQSLRGADVGEFDLIAATLPDDGASSADGARACRDAAARAAGKAAGARRPVELFAGHFKQDETVSELFDPAAVYFSVRDLSGRRLALLINSAMGPLPGNLAAATAESASQGQAVFLLGHSRESQWRAGASPSELAQTGLMNLVSRAMQDHNLQKLMRIDPLRAVSGRMPDGRDIRMRGYRLGPYLIALMPVEIRGALARYLKRRVRGGIPALIPDGGGPNLIRKIDAGKFPVLVSPEALAVAGVFDRLTGAAGFGPTRCASHAMPKPDHGIDNGFVWQFEDFGDCDPERAARTANRVETAGMVSYSSQGVGNVGLLLQGGSVTIRGAARLPESWTVGFRLLLRIPMTEACVAGKLLEMPGVTLHLHADCSVAMAGVKTRSLRAHEWSHVMLVRETNEVRLYLDAKLAAAADARPDSTGPAIHGTGVLIDDLAIWRSAMPPKKIYRAVTAPRLKPRAPVCEEFPPLCSPEVSN